MTEMLIISDTKKVINLYNVLAWTETLIIYINDSSINEKIVTLTISLFINKKYSTCLRSNNRYTVYLDKLYNIYLILKITTKNSNYKIIIFTDNQITI